MDHGAARMSDYTPEIRRALKTLDWDEADFLLAVECKSVTAQLSDIIREHLINNLTGLGDKTYLSIEQQEAYALLFKSAVIWDKDDPWF